MMTEHNPQELTLRQATLCQKTGEWRCGPEPVSSFMVIREGESSVLIPRVPQSLILHFPRWLLELQSTHLHFNFLGQVCHHPYLTLLSQPSQPPPNLGTSFTQSHGTHSLCPGMSAGKVRVTLSAGPGVNIHSIPCGKNLPSIIYRASLVG